MHLWTWEINVTIIEIRSTAVSLGKISSIFFTIFSCYLGPDSSLGVSITSPILTNCFNFSFMPIGTPVTAIKVGHVNLDPTGWDLCAEINVAHIKNTNVICVLCKYKVADIGYTLEWIKVAGSDECMV